MYAAASEGIVIGGVYAHYKKPNEPAYKVVSVALREEDFEPMVVYEHIGGGSRFIRTRKNFLEEVEAGGRRVPRFRLI